MERKILLADDDAEIREVVRILLEGEGYRVDEAADGISTVSTASDTYDLIILDVMMSGRSGFSACVEIHKKPVVPILPLTVRTQDLGETMGFDAGGDDHLTKLFPYTELTARVEAMIRRYHVCKGKTEEKEDGVVTIKDSTIQKAQDKVKRAGGEFLLTDLEYWILLLLAYNRGRISTIENIYESVWGEPSFYNANSTVMVHIQNLRKRLEANPESPKYVVNVWGEGYRVK